MTTRYTYTKEKSDELNNILKRLIIQESFSRKAHDLTGDEGFGNMWVDTFGDNTGILAGSSSGYTYRGTPNYDVIATVTYASQYPPAQSDTYVKATTKWDETLWPYFATDPTKLLTGAWANNAWLSAAAGFANQRFHIDLGSAKTVIRIYYENAHNLGGLTNAGAQNFTFWGSNSASDFADLTYANDGTWVQITPAQSTFDQHIAADQADPKYITVTNSTAYRYYAFKFADNYTNATYMGVRRIELQTSTASATVVSIASTIPSGTGGLIVWEQTTGTGSITAYLSADGEANWTEVTSPSSYTSASGTLLYKSVTGMIAGTSLQMKMIITGNSELESWAMGW